jgi:hypothetical protein
LNSPSLTYIKHFFYFKFCSINLSEFQKNGY